MWEEVRRDWGQYEDRLSTKWQGIVRIPKRHPTSKHLRTNMAKTQKQRSAEFRARKRETPEVRGIYAPLDWHDWAKAVIERASIAANISVTIATKRAKEKA